MPPQAFESGPLGGGPLARLRYGPGRRATKRFCSASLTAAMGKHGVAVGDVDGGHE